MLQVGFGRIPNNFLNKIPPPLSSSLYGDLTVFVIVCDKKYRLIQDRLGTGANRRDRHKPVARIGEPPFWSGHGVVA